MVSRQPWVDLYRALLAKPMVAQQDQPIVARLAGGFLRAPRSMLDAGADPDRLAGRAAAGTGG